MCRPETLGDSENRMMNPSLGRAHKGLVQQSKCSFNRAA